ncbi:hypothetical protein VNI00_004230 [Paramarasmius palmivorus]|uniref:F-box domain-containing protein n=1 Tax=Paramarasmius palmivorus TaxID=297713 RepID=A0AAW0DPJ5_9AGAR
MEAKAAPELPQDVLDVIMEKMNTFGDRQSLRQCALAARCLLPAAQRILFRRIMLYEASPWWPRGSRTNQFISLVKSSPHLAKYITELRLLVFYLDSPSEWDDAQSRKPLAPIIPHLHSLQKLQLNLVLRFDPTMAMVPVSSLQVFTFLGGTAMPRITSFSLSGSFPIDMNEVFGICEWLAAHGGLQDLRLDLESLRGLTTSPRTVSDPVKTVTPIYLRKLTITASQGITEEVLRWATSSISPLRFHELHELTVGNLTEQSSVYLLCILNTAKSSITCLRFKGSIPSLSAFHFNSFRHLRCIAYDHHLFNFEHSRTKLDEWCALLKRSRELRLESFIIQTNTNYKGSPLGDHLATFPNYPWNKLEDALVNGTKCRQVEIRIIMSHVRMGSDTLRECFPLLHDKSVGELVVRQRLSLLGSGELMGWEYSSYSGEWKNVPFESLLDLNAFW